jgi:hypothetical protein
MTFYEKGIVDGVCLAFVRWNGWGPPTSEYQILEFCRAKANSEPETEEYTEILNGWINGEYTFKSPLWINDDS